jgi:Acyltransferase family
MSRFLRRDVIPEKNARLAYADRFVLKNSFLILCDKFTRLCFSENQMPLGSNQAVGDDAGQEARVKVEHEVRSIQVETPEETDSGSGTKREVSSQRGTQNIAFIDSLRGLAALSIIAFHLYFLPATKLAISGGLLSCISTLGSGVPLFFIISGLTLSLSESRRKRSRYLAFLTRRVFRIFPLYLVVLAIMLALGQFFWHFKFPSRGELVLYVSLLFNLFPRHVEGLVWASWSLSVEIIFYLFFPLISRRVRAGFRPKIELLLCSLVLSVCKGDRSSDDRCLSWNQS